MFHVGPYKIEHPTILAPMAGVTDLPFRKLCREMGAGFAVSEMITADTRLWSSRKSQQRLIHSNESEPRSVQIAGAEPVMMADAAQQNVALGAQIIDLNMGCPAKKVCKKAAGSALLQDVPLVKEILQTVVAAVEVPVTLKIRTGWDTDNRNGVTIAKIAEDCGIAALSVHGRTRACRFLGEAEYDTIADIVNTVSIPVFANGDIGSPQKAKQVLDYTGAAAVMIGRCAQGRPWIFREINHYLSTGKLLPSPDIQEVRQLLLQHLNGLHAHYGDFLGVRIARKHVGWYLDSLCQQGSPMSIEHSKTYHSAFNRLALRQEQIDHLEQLLTTLERHQGQVA
jgi:tRNA-dihydrouridine synthase B